MTPEDLNRLIKRGRKVLASGLPRAPLRRALPALALGGTVAFADLATALRPPPDMKPSEWAQARRYVSPDGGSPKPGKWDNAFDPLAVAPLDALGPDHPARRVILPWAAQSAKTEVGKNWAGYVAEIERLPMLITLPGIDERNKFNRGKLSPMIEATPSLSRIIAPEGPGGSTVAYKHYPGGGLILASAKSSSSLQSISRARYWGDEIGEYPAETGSRGDPIAQAEKRLEAWSAIAKTLLTSTCQIKGSCRITQEFERSTRHYPYVPCPHCGDFHILQFDNLAWSNAGGSRRAVFSCPSCGADIEHHHKSAMLAGAFWVPTFIARDPAANPAPPPIIPPEDIAAWAARATDHHVNFGYHRWKAYSAMADWDSILTEFEEASGDPESFKVFYQQTLAEPWNDGGEAPDFEALAARVEGYDFTRVPHGALFVTGAMDVQIDRIEWKTMAWGPGLQGWVLEHGILEGATDQLPVWDAAQELWRTKTYAYPSGRELPVDLWGVDAGYRSPHVYAASRGYERVYALDGRGRGNPAAPPLGTPKTIRFKLGGKLTARTQIWPVGTYGLKSRLYGFLKTWESGPDETGNWPRGVLHFGENCDAGYFGEVTAEVLMPYQRRGGRIDYYWEKIPGRDNEQHDLAIYNMALACHLGWDRLLPEGWAPFQAERGAPLADGTQPDLAALWQTRPAPTAADTSEVLPTARTAAARLADRLARINSGDFD